MVDYKVVLGIKLFERGCADKKCSCRFWVPQSSKQKYCSAVCADLAGYGYRFGRQMKKRTLKNKLTKEDYE